MAVRIKVATANAPHRLRPHRRAWAWMDAQGVDIILAQEHTDGNDWRPSKRRWGRFRPQGTEDHNEASSNTIYWRRATIKKNKGGAIRLSSPGFRSYRALVWMAVRVKKGGGKPMRVASVHLPAFYSSRPKNRAEYDKQAPKVARWMRGGKNRIVGGDFNGVKGQPRMKPIEADVRLSAAVKSGPSGQKIDYVGARKRGGTWKIVKTERGPKFDSDHNIVIVTLEWIG